MGEAVDITNLNARTRERPKNNQIKKTPKIKKRLKAARQQPPRARTLRIRTQRGKSTHEHPSDNFTQNQNTPNNFFTTASQSPNSVNTDPKGGNRPLRIFLAISPKIKKRRKLPHRSIPELQLREYGPE